jgi:4-oxalocrotonate tautomerase family enzyme
MPRVTVEILEGRKTEQKRAIVEGICDSINEVFGSAKPNIAVRIAPIKLEDLAVSGELLSDAEKDISALYGLGEPRITVQHVEGRSLDQRRKLAGLITDRVAQALALPKDRVTIYFLVAKLTELAGGGVLNIDNKK